MSHSRIKVLILLGSTRPAEDMGPFPGRLSDRVSKFLLSHLPYEDWDPVVADPADDEFKLPLLEVAYHWSRALKRPVEPKIQRLNDLVDWAEAFVFVTPEYNYSMSPALANLINHIGHRAYGGKASKKPGMILTYSMGKFGGVRAAIQVRTMVSELGVLVCSNSPSIAEAHQVIDPEGNEIPQADESTPITATLTQAREELAFVARALTKERKLEEEKKPKKTKAKM